MEVLMELASVCRAAETDKVTERKRQMEKMTKLLNDVVVVKALDKCSDVKDSEQKKRSFTWDKLFKATKRILWAEGESLKKAKSVDTATSVKKKQEAAQLYKLVVKMADKRGPRLKSGDLVQDVIDVLSDPFMCSLFGMSHTSLLQKHILCMRKYWVEMSSKSWHELLGWYCKMLSDPPPHFDRTLLAQVVHTVVHGATQQCDIRGKKLLPLLQNYFTNVKQEKAKMICDYMVSSLNILCRALAPDGRTQLCRIGENTATHMLYLWNHRPSDKLKDELIDFFHLQMCAHHPQGVRTEEEGAFALDWDIWKGHMKRLYEVIYSDLLEHGGRNKFAASERSMFFSGRDMCGKPAYVTLMADLCHQLYSDTSACVLEVTQLSFLQSQPGGATKKRRLESGWSVLREAITAHGHTTQSVPWLQLVTVILDKYPLSLPEDELEPLLSVLQLLQGECRRVDVLSWMLRCLRSVAFSQQKSKNKLLDMTSDACAALWEKIWAATLRSLSLHHAEQEGFQLLTTLLQCHLLSADNNVWTLYLPGVCPPSAPAVDFLAAFLSCHDLPEKHRPGLLSVGTENGQESHPLRLQLLDWLIPNKEDTLVTAGGSTGCIQDANLLGDLLVVLTLRDTRHINLSSSHLKEEPDRYSQIEDIYLKTTFDCPLGKAKVDASENGKENGVKCSVLGKVQTHLLDLLQRDGRQLLDITTDPEVAQVERLVWQCQVIMKVIHAMLHHNVISGHQVAQLPLCDMLKLLMKRLGSWLGVVVRRESVPSLAGILSGMCDLLTVSYQHISSQRHQMALIIRAVTSPKILDQLFEIAYNKVLPPGGDDATPSTSSGLTRRPSRPAVDEFDDFDLDVNASMDIEEDNDALGESQGSDGLTPGSGSVCESLLSRSHLSDAQSIQLQAVKALCAWCDHSVEAASTVTSSRHPEFTPTDCKKKLLDLLSDDRWDCMKPFDLQLMQCIFEGLCGSDQNLSGEEVEEIVDVLREACKAHRRDQETCAVLLNLMSRLVPHLQDTHDMVSPAMQRARELCAYLHGIFWKLSQSLEYIVSTRVVIAQSMQAYLQVDPDASWAIYKRRDEEDVAMVDEYCKLLSDKNVTLRLHAASRLAILFERAHGGASVAQERWKQNDMFDSVYNTQIEIMDIEGRLSEDEIKDESVCRASSLLHTLSSVARISPVCERKALFAVCQMYKEHNLNKLLVKKVLCQVARDLHYSSLQSYMSTHLPYIIQQWFIQKYTLDNFPYPLMGYTTRKDFYEAQCNVLVPFVVMNKDLDSVSQMGEVMQCAWKDLLLDGVPHILIHILPLFAASKSAHLADDRALRKRIPHATACYDLLTKVISKESVQKAMGSHLEDIVVNTLMTLQTSSPEGAAASSDAHSNDPIPNPPHFKRETVIATLEYLTQSYGGNVNSVVALLAKSQDGIQRVLLSLRTHMAQSHRPHETRRILHMYSLFVKLLLEEFQGGLGGSWAYVLRDVTFTLIHTLHLYSMGECSSMEGDVACMCVDLLHSVCQTAAVSCPEELCHFMPTIISAVLPSVGKERKLSKLCVGLIELLLVEHGGSLQVALAVLDPLPDIQVLAAARKRLDHYRDPTRTDLAQEIRRFLELTELCAVPSSDSRLSGLIFLKEQLAGNKPQLSQLVSECENDQGNSLLVRLVYELIQLTKSTNQDVAQEAGRCLGEIGPVDLSVVAIETRPLSQSLASAVKSFEDNSSMKQYCYIFHLLDKYLMEASVPVVTAASQVLKQILSTKTGLAFYSSYKDNVKDTFFQYLRPFKTKSKVAAVSDTVISEEVFLERVDEVLLWLPNHADHGRWVCDLACRLADCSAIYDEVLRLLTPVCKVKEEFSEKVIPYLIHNILLHGSQVHKDVLSRHIKDFFASHCGVYEQAGSRPTTPSTPEPSGECTVTTNKDSVGVMLNVIQYLRLQDRPAQGRQKFTSWDNNMWLDVDFLHIAKAAQNCRAYFTTLLYSEIWCDIHRASADTEEFSEGSTWDAISQVAAPTNIDIQSLMLEAYQSIGDPDGMYGCGAGRLAQMSSRMRMYEHEGRWNEALGAYDLHMLQSTASKTQLGLLKAMQNFGLGHVLDLYLRGLTSQHSTHLADIQDVQYEAAWRNTTWDLATPTRFDGSCGYHQCVYSSLWAVKEGDEAMLTSAVRFARRGVLECVASCSLESVRSLYPSLAQLQCLSHIEDAATLPQSLTQLNLRAITNKWLHREAGLDNDYAFMEPVLSLRCSLLHTLHTRGQCAATLQALTAQLECATSMARQASRHQLAERALQQLRHLVTVESSAESWSWQIEEAKLCWARGEQETAKHLLKVLTGKLEKAQDESMEAARIYPQCLGVFGDWLAHTHSENATVIMDNYLKKAVDLLEVMGCEDDAALDSFLALGRFADGQYQNRDNYMKSSTFEAKQALARQAKEDALQLQRMGDTKTRYYRTLARQSDIDEKEVASLISDKDKFLLCAVHNYLKCLQGGHKHDLRVFRLTSLWFDNATNNSVNSEVKKCISKIQSYKFLPLMYQLAARMSQAQQHDKDLFQPTLDKVIERTVLDHPHHTMFIILALAHANKDNAAFQNTGRKSTGRLSKSTSQDQEKEEDRVLAAKAMVGRVKQSHRAEIITDMERLCLAYIQLANWNVEKYKTETKAIKLPEMIKIKQMKHLTNVAIPTVETKVDPSCKYDNIVYIEEFESTFKLAGGINLPKIISCVGSDGVARRQLVKGKDDLRQDAVMQQVFSLVNNMLHKVPNSRKRKLQVRTYKVIPLSQRSGLLEWCEGTIPIGAYLTGHPNGAHQRYRPGDLKASECRSKLADAHNGKSRLSRYDAFREVCRKFQPVFRHFFMEKFPDPAQWYERQLAYTRSVATNSIVGYILGLGDRHVQNILIDCQTAELIHIDLGVAFEQGKILPTPETVPFRLTRDIVDGMGVAGVEGAFRRCCEATMEVMHQSHEALLTILQVLLYDPLSAWTISPLKAYALQQRRESKAAAEHDTDINTTGDILDITDTANNNSNSGDTQDNVNKMAERVLLRLRQKLQGLEEGVQLSVSGQVNMLIQEARDQNNLCRLFPGWQPYI